VGRKKKTKAADPDEPEKLKRVRHNGKWCRYYPPQLHEPPPPAYPTADPLWPVFVAFVRAGGVVRADLLSATDGQDEDWRLVWGVFRAGADARPEG
jgi:hypothetical protein